MRFKSKNAIVPHIEIPLQMSGGFFIFSIYSFKSDKNEMWPTFEQPLTMLFVRLQLNNTRQFALFIELIRTNDLTRKKVNLQTCRIYNLISPVGKRLSETAVYAFLSSFTMTLVDDMKISFRRPNKRAFLRFK